MIWFKRPRKPCQTLKGSTSSTVKRSCNPGTRAANCSSRGRKMMSEGRRAAWTKTISGISPLSQAQVVIDIIGVIPEPAEMKRYFRAGCWRRLNTPAGPCARSRIPGFSCSISQREPTDPGCAFTVTDSDKGREGEDEIV